MPLILAVVVAVVAITVAWGLLSHRSSTPTPSSSPQLTAAQALKKLCDDIPIDQNLRVGALRTTEALVRPDAEALRKAGDLNASQKAVAVATAEENLAVVLGLGTQGDTTSATDQLRTATDAVSALCTAG
jgi:hypothetical protein